MYARVGTYQGEADGLVQGFEGQTEALQQVEGFERAYFLIDRDAGKAMTITLWESQGALEASAEAASKMRDEATQPTGAQTTDVANYEVAITVGD